MSEPYVLKYRPKTFKDMIGQDYIGLILERMVVEDMVPPAMLFSGPSGVGKTTAARILVERLQAEGSVEVDGASSGGVDEIRKLLEIVRYSTGGAYRVLILDEAQSITRAGFEALLKVLEEPPAKTIFVLCSTEPWKIPETILSRMIEFSFNTVSPAAILDRLKTLAVWEDLRQSDDILAYIAKESGGNVRTAFQSLDLVVRANIMYLEEYKKLTGVSDPGPQLLAALTTGQHDRIFSLLDQQLTTAATPQQIQASLVECIRDLFVLKAGGKLSVVGEALESRQALARTIESERLMFAARTLWDLYTKLRNVDDPRGNLELALILIAEAFTRGRATPKPEPAPAASEQTTRSVPEVASTSPRLSLSDMQRTSK